jgi:hypothetical protein
MNNQMNEYIQSLEIIDTHEHLMGTEHDYQDQKKDILQEIICTYVQNDLISAGMDKRLAQTILDHSIPVAERWPLISPYWKRIRFTGYGHMVREGIWDLLGMELDADPIQAINDCYLKLVSDHPYQTILRDKSKIKIALLDKMVPNDALGITVNIIDSQYQVDDDFFKSIYHLDNFIFPQVINDIHFLEDKQDTIIFSLDDWCECCYRSIRNAVQHHVVGFKLALAYKRSLDFPCVSKPDAEKAFLRILKNKIDVIREPLALQADEDFQNYMLHQIIQFIREFHLPVQIHTGIQAGNANYLANTNPLLLNNLFMLYPDVKFILFHMGIPFQKEAAMLVKMFPNVYLDACWAHIISPQATISAMREWMESIPVNKVTAFGGDLSSPVCVYGHQKIARRNIAKALESKITEKVLNADDAEKIASAWLFENAYQIYGLSAL